MINIYLTTGVHIYIYINSYIFVYTGYQCLNFSNFSEYEVHINNTVR